MDRLTQTHQFRSHWIQNNTTALREFASGLADLERTRGEVRERRVLLRSTASPTAPASNPGPVSFLRWLQMTPVCTASGLAPIRA